MEKYDQDGIHTRTRTTGITAREGTTSTKARSIATGQTSFHVGRRALIERRLKIDAANVPEGRVVRLPQSWGEEVNNHLAQVLVDNLWVERRLRDGWIAAYRIVAAPDASPVVAELRVYPAEADPLHQPGEWAGALRGIHAPVPAGGLTSRL